LQTLNSILRYILSATFKPKIVGAVWAIPILLPSLSSPYFSSHFSEVGGKIGGRKGGKENDFSLSVTSCLSLPAPFPFPYH